MQANKGLLKTANNFEREPYISGIARTHELDITFIRIITCR